MTETFLYLPGFSLKNLEEMESFETAFAAKGMRLLTHRWRHWDDESIEWNVDVEFNRVIGLLNTNMELDSKLTIIAKSLGSHIAVNLIKSLDIHRIKQLFILGLPINDLTTEEQSDYIDVLRLNEFPATLIHNRDDSHGNVKDLQNMLEGIDYKLLIKERDHHRYYYSDDILKLLNV